jgi:MFS family permease
LRKTPYDTLTSFACGVAPNIEVLIAGRLLQGASAAMLSPQVFALVRMSFADGGERTTAFGAMGAVIGLANVAGLILGGALIQADLFGLAWRMVFLVNLPVGIVAILLTPLVLADVRSGERKRLNLAGVRHSPLATAASLAILGGAFGIVSPIAGRLASFGVRRIMMAGVLVDLVGMLLALVLCWTVDPLPAAWLLPSLLLVGVGMGLFMTPILNAVMSGIHDRHVGSRHSR